MTNNEAARVLMAIYIDWPYAIPEEYDEEGEEALWMAIKLLKESQGDDLGDKLIESAKQAVMSQLGLLPCSCGNETPELFGNLMIPERYYVRCPVCNEITEEYEYAKEAADAWNANMHRYASKIPKP